MGNSIRPVGFSADGGRWRQTQITVWSAPLPCGAADDPGDSATEKLAALIPTPPAPPLPPEPPAPPPPPVAASAVALGTPGGKEKSDGLGERPVGVPVGTLVGWSAAVGNGAGVELGAGVAVALALVLAVALAVALGTGVAAGVAVAPPPAPPPPTAVGLAVALGLTIAVGLAPSVGLAVAVGACVGVALGTYGHGWSRPTSVHPRAVYPAYAASVSATSVPARRRSPVSGEHRSPQA
jgi:hypothetical protein